ncbi:uncharacterized protein BO95DRAFT_385957 [Aspergillus brunneoviolaceus CBS 621.78]|uniref:DUF1740-domain-containing protein n=1 Tax=Aspergillus brunneoviolaceus CBS 621.78 TaxID=1450534 RepID=A0ACD1GDJ6_9EURO|nr:DUF1740-domain-containing protein [Aspergillus brunneoviolaceus CBS 621.78]RAH47194.1 DUF1740-domain-containing protein [Aspergillus brunneoviolaceus CBS 621.78]
MDSSGSQEKKPVPRFASFKPPPPPEADRPPERPRRDNTGHEDKSRSHSERQSRHRSHRDRSRSRERRRRHRDREHHSNVNKANHHDRTTSETPHTSLSNRDATKKDDASDLYVIDLKGDKHNLIYGTLHRYSVPDYYRVGRGNVLGLPSSYRIDRDSVVEDKLVIRNETQRKGLSRNKTKSILSGLSKQHPRLLRFKPQSLLDAAADFSKDYLPLSTSGSRKHRVAFGDPETDDEKYAYRSIHGKAKPEDHLPSDVEATSDSDADEDGIRGDPDEQIKQRNALLSRNLEKSSADIGSWLEYIAHQESLLRGSAGDNKPLTYAEKQSLADIKLSLYEKALSKVGQSEAKDRLLIGFLEEGAKLWDTKKLAAQWQTVLRSNSQFISLWVKYLDFCQTEFLNFTYQRCLDTYIECLRLNQSAPENPGKSQVQMYLFLRLTLFMREAGFAEHAAALWQAVLEVAFFRPEPLKERHDSKEVIPPFLDFWESEVARIGDAAAKGWKSGSKDLPTQQEFNPVFRLDPKRLIPSWAPCEREKITNARLPAFSLNESEHEDPYRVILASDLDEILTLVWEVDSPTLLLDGFLSFCRLPPMVTAENQSSNGRRTGDPFVRNEIMSTAISRIDDWVSRACSADESTALSPFRFPQINLISTIETLIPEQGRWFSSLDTWNTATSNSEFDVVPMWVRRALRLLVDANPSNDDLAEFALCVEFSCSSKDAKKFAKSLLKKRSTSLRLYNAYALMERRSGNHGAADHVWATALSMSRTFPDHDRVDSILLWQTWLWELLDTGNMAHASYILLSIPQNSIDLSALPQDSTQATFTPTSLLKIQSHLSELQEKVLAHRKATNFTASTASLAILSYLTNSQDLHKALEAYTHALDRLSSLPQSSNPFQTYTTELLHQSRARLLYHHIHTRRTYKPSHIRTLLSESITLFPHNTIFLSLFAWTEARFRIDDRVRSVVRDIIRNSNITTTTTTKNPTDPYNLSTPPIPITTHLFSIYTELSRPVFAGSTAHSVRAAFEEAIGDDTPKSAPSSSSPSSTSPSSSSSARSNPSTWKLYILFELAQREIHRAKEVFYRGMRACPWSKELIMLAFTHLRADILRPSHLGDAPPRKGEEGMGFDELRHVYNVLVEKELRIHVDIEQELDDLAARRMVEMQGAGWGEFGGGVIRMPDDGDDSEGESRVGAEARAA